MANPRLTIDPHFADSEGLPLRLSRMREPDPDATPNEHKPPVLLVHGASAQHETFCIPEGASLAETLSHEFDTWLLDWRASRVVTDAMQPWHFEDFRKKLDFDFAEQDFAKAIDHIRGARGDNPIRVVAHCMGAGVVAQAIAKRTVEPEHLDRVVLMTLGLFYETPLDGMMKSQVRVIDRLWQEGTTDVIDPRDPDDKQRWPDVLQDVYKQIGHRWRPHPDGGVCAGGSSHALCNRVSFMYGFPYKHSNLGPEIHGAATVSFTEGAVRPGTGERIMAFPRPKSDDASLPGLDARLLAHEGLGFVSGVDVKSGSWRRRNAIGKLTLSGSVGKFPASGFDLWADDQKIAKCAGRPKHDVPYELRKQFGGIPVRMYLHGIQNVRRGWAAPFVEPGTGLSRGALQDSSYINEEALANFREVPSVTLITGAENQLWRRDGIERMYEWLMKGRRDKSRRIRLHILNGYAHQDLLWGENARRDVFLPYIIQSGLKGATTSHFPGPIT